jgi:hypothetical protein
MFCRALLLSCKLAASPMATPAARPIHGFVNVPVIAEANPVVYAHALGSCSTARGDDGSSVPRKFRTHGRTGQSKNEKHRGDALHERWFSCWDLVLLPAYSLGGG